MSEKKLRVTLLRSPIGKQERHKRTIRALGFTKHQMSVEQPDNPSVRGMLAQISHLIKVEEVKS